MKKFLLLILLFCLCLDALAVSTTLEITNTGGVDSSILDKSDEYRWAHENAAANLISLEISMAEKEEYGWALLLEKERSALTGLVGHYDCLFLCGYFSYKSIDADDPYSYIRYTSESITLLKWSEIAISPFNNVDFYFAPRVTVSSVNAIVESKNTENYKTLLGTVGIGLKGIMHLTKDSLVDMEISVNGMKASNAMLDNSQLSITYQKPIDNDLSFTTGVNWRAMKASYNGVDNYQFKLKGLGLHIGFVKSW